MVCYSQLKRKEIQWLYPVILTVAFDSIPQDNDFFQFSKRMEIREGKLIDSLTKEDSTHEHEMQTLQ